MLASGHTQCQTHTCATAKTAYHGLPHNFKSLQGTQICVGMWNSLRCIQDTWYFWAGHWNSSITMKLRLKTRNQAGGGWVGLNPQELSDVGPPASIPFWVCWWKLVIFSWHCSEHLQNRHKWHFGNPPQHFGDSKNLNIDSDWSESYPLTLFFFSLKKYSLGPGR